MVFGISVNTSKKNYEEIVDRIQSVLKSRLPNSVIKVFLDGEGLGKEKGTLSFLFIVGGDGTILRSVKLMEDCDVPLVGVNYGTLGFMASVEINDIEKAIDKIINDDFYIDKRLMLEAYHDEDDSKNKRGISLNDIVITKLPLSRLLKFKIFIDDKYYSTFSGDGLIISTPTGSTAYSLSSGGPIVYPNIEAIIITPICPHSLNAKSLVISSDSTIKLEIDEVYDNSYLVMDGQMQEILLGKQVLNIRKYEKYCSLVRFDFYDYYCVLREKLINRI